MNLPLLPRSPLPAFCLAVLLVTTGCVNGPITHDGRFFQYASTDGKVVAEYDAHDAATCARHLANLRKSSTHGADTLRCSSTSAANRLPTTASADDGRGNTFEFRFETREQCQRMLPAITSGGTISRQCA